MTNTLHRDVITDVCDDGNYRVRLADGREVVAALSRLHFGHRPDALDDIESLEIDAAVTVRLNTNDPESGSLVRVVTSLDEWQSSNDPAALLETVRDTANERELRLFACACCRSIWDMIPAGTHRYLVDVIEAYAQGNASATELRTATAAGADEARQMDDLAHDAEHDLVQGPELASTAKAIWATRIAAYISSTNQEFEIALDAARACVEAVGLRAESQAAAANSESPESARASAVSAECTAQAAIVRRLFDNPFQTGRG